MYHTSLPVLRCCWEAPGVRKASTAELECHVLLGNKGCHWLETMIHKQKLTIRGCSPECHALLAVMHVSSPEIVSLLIIMIGNLHIPYIHTFRMQVWQFNSIIGISILHYKHCPALRTSVPAQMRYSQQRLPHAKTASTVLRSVQNVVRSWI